LQVWNDCLAAQEEGADIRAVTVWSLLGSFDWNSLVTRAAGHYEPGIFDLSGGNVRATILADAVRNLATNGDYVHPFLATEGWWRRTAQLERCA
jgi:dTDP-4-dehydrorhamnose reductase